MSDLNYYFQCQYVNQALIKRAGVGDLLSGLSGSVMNFGKEHIDTSSVFGVLESLANLMAPGILFKIHPALGILATVAETLGFEPSSIIKTIVDFVSGKIKSGQNVSLTELNDVGKDAVATEAGPLTSENRYFDLSHLISVGATSRDYYAGAGKKLDIPFFGGDSNAPLGRVFGNLLETQQTGKAKWLVGGFIVWIIKTLLLGAGLVAAGEGLKHLLTPKSTNDSSSPTNTSQLAPNVNSTTLANQTTNMEPSSSNSAPPATNLSLDQLEPTGQGSEIHPNQPSVSLWYVPLIGGTLENTVITWAGYVYRKLQNQEEFLSTLKSFRNVVQNLRSNLESGASSLAMPTQYKSIKQVVDTFAPEALQKLQG